MLEERQHERPEGGAVRDRELHHDRAVGGFLDDVVGADVLHGPARLGSVDAHARSHRRFGTELPGASRLTRHRGGGHVERWPVDDGDLAVDAIEAIVPLLLPQVVKARQVPARRLLRHWRRPSR